jgi:hypothetical protein
MRAISILRPRPIAKVFSLKTTHNTHPLGSSAKRMLTFWQAIVATTCDDLSWMWRMTVLQAMTSSHPPLSTSGRSNSAGGDALAPQIPLHLPDEEVFQQLLAVRRVLEVNDHLRLTSPNLRSSPEKRTDGDEPKLARQAATSKRFDELRRFQPREPHVH